jgi:NADH:ubiquinone oxidoreductase subunit C
MNWLPAPVEDLFGPDATLEDAYDLLTVDVPPATWLTALETARTTLSCTYFDWLSAVDEPQTAAFHVCAHLASVSPGAVRRLLLRTSVPHAAPVLASAVDVYAGAAWHERETHEMFGVDFTGHPHLVPLLLPDTFEGHPLRKDFVLAARVAKAWPGAKEPGESEHGTPKRRQMLPPGVPDPNDWGPQKGQLPPAPTRRPRPTTTTTPSEAPARRTRSASEGSTSQTPDRPPRRSRSASEGSASQTPATPPRRSRSASDGSASQTPPRLGQSAARGGTGGQGGTPAPGAPATGPGPDPAAETPGTTDPRPSDAPWHNPRPAFDDADTPTTPAAEDADDKTPKEPRGE